MAGFPAQRAHFDAELAADLARIPRGRSKTEGIEVGKRAAAAILAQRVDDGSDFVEPRIGIDYIPGDEPGIWRQDPVSLLPVALGESWGEVEPLVLMQLKPGVEWRPPIPEPPPADWAAGDARA